MSLPLPRPIDARMLDVGDGHWLYVEEVGVRGGVPAVFLHGGPGSGSQHPHRSLFDIDVNHAFLFDQRGSGRSHPYLGLAANTTQHLIRDIEAIRVHFGIERWIVVGGSWGSTLAVAYAEAHPERVVGLVLRAIFLGTRDEVTWAFVEGPKRFRPELYEDWIAHLDTRERDDPIQAYCDRLADPDRARHAPAARAWYIYERALSELTPGTTRLPPPADETAPLPPTPFVEAHYIRNDFFLAPDQLLRDTGRLAGIPGVIVQGRYDLLCPPVTAHALASRWADCRLTFIEAAGHSMGENGVMAAMRDAISAMSAGARRA